MSARTRRSACNPSQPPDRVDEALVLRLAPIPDVRGLGLADPAIREEAAAQRAVGEEPHAVFEAKGAHLLGGTAIKEREAHLVRNHRKAVLHQEAEVVRVEVGEAEMPDAALVPQRHQLLHAVDVAGVLVGPPMKLQEIDGIHIEPLQALRDAGAHHVAGHGSGRRAPLGEGARAFRAEPLQEAARDELRAAVMVGHVEAVEARSRIFRHGRGSGIPVEQRAAAFHVGHLPEAGDDPADLEARCKGGTVGACDGHRGIRQRKGPRAWRGARNDFWPSA
jgi:hypothetical protein